MAPFSDAADARKRNPISRLLCGYWAWLGSSLQLTLGGRLVFSVVALLGLIAVVGDETTGGVDGPNAAAALGFYVLVTLLAIVAADAAFRLGRSATQRSRGPRNLG